MEATELKRLKAIEHAAQSLVKDAVWPYTPRPTTEQWIALGNAFSGKGADVGREVVENIPVKKTPSHNFLIVGDGAKTEFNIPTAGVPTFTSVNIWRIDSCGSKLIYADVYNEPGFLTIEFPYRPATGQEFRVSVA